MQLESSFAVIHVMKQILAETVIKYVGQLFHKVYKYDMHTLDIKIIIKENNFN